MSKVEVSTSVVRNPDYYMSAAQVVRATRVEAQEYSDYKSDDGDQAVSFALVVCMLYQLEHYRQLHITASTQIAQIK